MPRQLVTGGAGFIGSWIVDRLVERGDDVVVLDNLATGRAQNLAHLEDRITWMREDIADLDVALRACEGVDVVFHQAAIPSVPRSIEDPLGTHHTNVTGALTILEAARRQGVRRVVYAASSSAYGGAPEELPKREGQRPTPLSPYAVAKLAAEQYCAAYTRSFGLETVALRYFNIFGPRQDPNSPYSAVIAKFCKLLLSGERPTVYGDGEQTRDFTFVANAVDANLLAAEAPGAAGQVFNIGCGTETSLLELLALIGELTGTALEPQFGPERAGDPRRSVADIARAREVLGYDPQVDLRSGLERLLEVMRRDLATC